MNISDIQSDITVYCVEYRREDVAMVKSGKTSTKHLKVKKGAGEFLALRLNREEHPMLDKILKAENRLTLKRDFGITLSDETDWPTSYGRYSDRLGVLLEYLVNEGQKKIQSEKNGGDKNS